mmetsp:Transcript_12823/g.37226  ORF Transcript_12823/g.37226 Transcript_12823/m.37226 type:complete len:272 (+) Transcript_12823:366-1181(+)
MRCKGQQQQQPRRRRWRRWRWICPGRTRWKKAKACWRRRRRGWRRKMTPGTRNLGGRRTISFSCPGQDETKRHVKEEVPRSRTLGGQRPRGDSSRRTTFWGLHRVPRSPSGQLRAISSTPSVLSQTCRQPFPLDLVPRVRASPRLPSLAGELVETAVVSAQGADHHPLRGRDPRVSRRLSSPRTPSSVSMKKVGSVSRSSSQASPLACPLTFPSPGGRLSCSASLRRVLETRQGCGRGLSSLACVLRPSKSCSPCPPTTSSFPSTLGWTGR